MITPTNPDGFLFYFGAIWIDAEHERCKELVAECPEVPVANNKTLELYAAVLHGKTNAETRLKLLREAILADDVY